MVASCCFNYAGQVMVVQNNDDYYVQKQNI